MHFALQIGRQASEGIIKCQSEKRNMLEWLLRAIVFIFPAYVANASPVILGGGAPIDGGRTLWDGRPVFGKGKTWKGLILGILAGTVVGAVLAFIVPPALAFNLPFNDRLVLGFALSAGALCGDLAGSFTKRRLGYKSGAQSMLLDQLPFLAFALLFAAPFHLVSVEEAVFLAVLTIVMHVLTNRAAHVLKLKKVPW